MPTKPSQLPEWATDGDNIIEPSGGRKAAGWLSGNRPPAQTFNWWQNLAYRWLQWIDQGKPWRLERARMAAANAQGEAFGFATAGIQAGGCIYNGTTWDVLFAGSNGDIVTLNPLNTITKTQRTSAGGYNGTFRAYTFHGVAGAGFGVLVGDGGEIQTSSSGVTWTKRTQAGAYAGNFLGAAHDPGSGTTVIVGLDGEIQRSTNATSWTHIAAAGGFTENFRDVVWCEALDLFVAVGDDGMVQTSPTGLTWTVRATPATADLLKVVCSDTNVAADAELLAHVADGSLLKSNDAITWTVVPMSTGNNVGFGVLLYLDGVWHIFGDNGLAAVSIDRDNWSALEVGRYDDGTIDFAAVAVPPLRSKRWFVTGGAIDSFFYSLGI
jgi:hypothetical protein